MESTTRYPRIRAVTVAGLTALALVIALPAAYAQVPRTGSQPWYQQSTVDAQRQAQALFEQAVDKHQQLLRGEAKELYEQALALWDNPDIRWNLALVLDDLGQYVRAHQQLEGALLCAEEKLVKQAEVAKAGFEQAVANVREITDLVQKSNTEVAALIQGRFVAQIDEVKAAIAKVAKK